MRPHFTHHPVRSALRVLAPAILLLALVLAPLPAAATTPLGATIVGSSVQFALFSANATRVEVWIFATPTASTPSATYALTKTDVPNNIWTVTVAGLGAGTLYGYRVWGPNWTYNASWTPGSNLGFVSHVDVQRQPLQPQQAADRPLRQGGHRRAGAGQRPLLDGHPRRHQHLRLRRQRRGDAEVDRDQRHLLLGDRGQAQHRDEGFDLL